MLLANSKKIIGNSWKNHGNSKKYWKFPKKKKYIYIYILEFREFDWNVQELSWKI